MDENVSDIFIECNSFKSLYLCSIFNVIFDSGVYPDAWSKGIIVPIYTKGDVNDSGKYRGITLVNVIGKICSLSLRNRINSWCESEGIFYDYQFGFRVKELTIDAIFIFHTMIQKILAQDAKLYCIFIDYERAFDSIIMEALCLKLIEIEIGSKMIVIIKAIYKDEKSSVKLSTNMEMSQFFNVSVGLKQGESLLFIVFINDMFSCINVNSLVEKDFKKYVCI